jgi:hypothetical protein
MGRPKEIFDFLKPAPSRFTDENWRDDHTFFLQAVGFRGHRAGRPSSNLSMVSAVRNKTD